MTDQAQRIRDDMKAIAKVLEWMDRVSEDGRDYLKAQIEQKLASDEGVTRFRRGVATHDEG